MFPIELVVKIAEIVLAEVGKGVGNSLLSRQQDSRKKFGRDLFAFYEELNEYVEACHNLAYRLENTDFERLDVDTANSLGNKLANITGNLVDKFFPALEKYYEAAGFELTGRKPSKRAKRRAAVMDMYDHQLVLLIRTAYQTDMDLISLIKQIDRIYFDDNSGQALVYFPINNDLTPILPYLGWGSPLQHPANYTGELPLPISKIWLCDYPQLSQKLVALLLHNIKVVKALQVQMKKTIQKHFTIDDLL